MAKNIVTPIGVAEYPRLNKPDTKFNEDGTYQVNLILDPDNEKHEAFINELEQVFEEGIEKIKEDQKKSKIKIGSKPWELVDDEEDKQNGMYRLRFRMKAIVRPRKGEPFEQSPKLFDAKKQPCPDAKVGAGSMIKVAFEPVPYYNAAAGSGVSLRLKAVQILKLVEYGDGDFGFDEEEGYSTEAPAVEDGSSDF